MGAEQPDARFDGVYAATTLPFAADGSVDLDRFAEHCTWLVAEGVAGIVPNGSLGEYEALTPEERAAVTRTAVEACATAGTDSGTGTRSGAAAGTDSAGTDSGTATGTDSAATGTGTDTYPEVIPGVAGKGGDEARRWTEQAAELGCPAVMALPPTSHAPTASEVVAHYREIAAVGLPIVAYNNPFSTRVDLVPELLARLADEVPEVVAVKEFSQDGRRVARIRELAPRLEVLCGCDDLLVESMLLGATGWIAGFVNAFPAQSVTLHRLCRQRRWDEATALYLRMLPILRWDADPRFVQAIKLGQEEAGRYGGPVRLPRLPLGDEDVAEIRAAARAALDAGTPAVTDRPPGTLGMARPHTPAGGDAGTSVEAGDR